ncbi:hypothetical protein PHJA_000680700 [Phtheirospermum japonicum]|uniref:Metallo-beta-lactamase domain-containing protein n=1 Tax=Phtheirospermum japonicum TaxID=374723 RepID=A0A830BCN3_9LAMI|nr:hypothetical protein PHJA_000680700 [Phtheirospermum japonicum]
MGTQKVNLAVIIKNPSNDDEFVLIKQNPPPKFNDPEYDSYQDSDLWDLPSVQLSPLDSPLSSNQVKIEAEENYLLELLNQFDFDSAVNQVFEQVGLEKTIKVKWNFSKLIEEPEFGPGIPVKTVYIVGKLETHDGKLEDCSKWMSTKECADLLLEVKPCNDRVGSLVVVGLLNDSMQFANSNIPPTLRSQEYPPGVKVVPMRSRTAKPFHTTNLVVFAPRNNYDDVVGGDNFVANGDALIIDPGCSSTMHKELEQIITALPRKLIVFVTHHHHDHVDGLSVVQKYNPDATLLAHENTFRRIRKDDWSLGYIPVVGSEEICIGGQRCSILSLSISKCVELINLCYFSQGSSLLDITSGGNMSDYFRTTYKFMELSPHVLIPMHGRINMWPKHMLCGYLKNRRNRESTILKAIEDGAKTLFDIVASTYADVDRSLWIHAASNVRLHVDHLAEQNKLPKDFSMQKFQSTFKIFKVLGAGAVAGIAVFYSFRQIGMIINDHFKKFVLYEDLSLSSLNAFPPLFSSAPSSHHPCQQQCNNISNTTQSFKEWISPNDLWHSMSDEELRWRASMVPRIVDYPFNRTRKVAFMFLTRGKLPLAPLWEMFFKGHEGLFSIYLHTLPEFTNEPDKSSVFYKRRIPSKLVQWGKSTMIDAERRLLANALLDFTNERFVLLSETCIPLFNFSTIYIHLINANQSFLSTFDDPRPIGRGRYNKRMGPAIELSDWRKGSQWFEVNRELALAIVSDVTYYPIFRNHCLPPCYMDEHYLPTLVTKICPNLTSNMTITWTDWSEGGSHPRMFKRNDVTQGFLESIRNGFNCTYNGEMSSICYLFTRKFHPSTLQPLLKIAPKLLGFSP